MVVGILTVSDRCSKGESEDTSGALLAQLFEESGHTVKFKKIVPDEIDQICGVLTYWSERCELIITTGGTGMAPRDVTPEATAALIERPAPGFSEMLRFTGYQLNKRAILSRGISGIVGECLIINLPGSSAAVQEGMEVLLPLLPHAVAILKHEPTDH